MPLKEIHERLVKYCQKAYSQDYLEKHLNIQNETTGVQCFFVIDGHQLIICFRGSDSADDWRMNFHMSQSEYPKGSGCMVHSGFLVQWLSIEVTFREMLKKLLEDHSKGVREVVFCGHSAGGQCVIAAYATRDILDKHSLAVKGFTFGSPRLGNKKFKETVEKYMDVTRIVLDRDVITRVPYLGYEHLGKPVQIRDDCVLERETSTLEHLHWMALGAKTADAGIRDHFISNYRRQICKWVSE